MRVNRAKIGSAAVAVLAAMTVMVMTGCGYGAAGVPEEPPPVLMVEIFNLVEHLETLNVGETNRDVIFDDIPLLPAGGATAVSFEVINFESSRALRVTISSDWAGIDLAHENWAGYSEGPVFGFQVGDEVTIVGRVLGTGTALEPFNQAVFMAPGPAWRTFDGTSEGREPATGTEWVNTEGVEDGAFEREVTLNAADITRIAAANPPTIRFRANAANAVYVITDLIVERNMAAPAVNVGNQIGTVVRGEGGDVAYRTVRFPVSASFLEGAAGTINFSTAGVVTGLPEGVTVAEGAAGGSIAIAADGSGATTAATHLTLIVAADADLSVNGDYTFTVTLRDTESMPGDIVISGLIVDELVTFGAEDRHAIVEVEAFRLAARGSLPLFVTGDLPTNVTVTSAGIVLDANGSGRSTVVFSGPPTDSNEFGDMFRITVEVPGTRASESFDLLPGTLTTVFDMQDFTTVEAEDHFEGYNNRGDITVTVTGDNMTVAWQLLNPLPGWAAQPHDSVNGGWIPLRILRPGTDGVRLNDVLTVTGRLTGGGVPVTGIGHIGLARDTSLIGGTAAIHGDGNSLPATFEVTHTLTSTDVDGYINIMWNLWGWDGNFPSDFVLHIDSVVVEGYR